MDGPGSNEQDKGNRETADDLGLVFALGSDVEEGDSGEGEDRMEPGDGAHRIKEREEADDEVDVDEDGDDALEDGLRALGQGDDNNSQDQDEQERSVMLMSGEERIHDATLNSALSDSSPRSPSRA